MSKTNSSAVVLEVLTLREEVKKLKAAAVAEEKRTLDRLREKELAMVAQGAKIAEKALATTALEVAIKGLEDVEYDLNPNNLVIPLCAWETARRVLRDVREIAAR